MTIITRNEGYKRAAGKEEQSENIFYNWSENYGINTTKTQGYDNNRLYGDYILPNNSFLELKSQNVGQYSKNFIEIGEYTRNTLHSEGYETLSKHFKGYGITDLENIKLTNRNKTITTFGKPEHFNVGMTPVFNGAHIMYINISTELIYFYSNKKFLSHIMKAVANNGFHRGLGMSNEDSVAVFIPNSEVSWQKQGNEWVYTGNKEFETPALQMFSK